MTPPVGVLRAVLDLDDPTVPADADVETTGRLWVQVPDDELVGTVVLYTLDRNRLLGMLAAARAGASDDDIMLALDAAALDEVPADEDEDGG